MKRQAALLTLALFLAAGIPGALLSQEQEKKQENVSQSEPESRVDTLESKETLYTSSGRRDPFKDLLGGAEGSEKPGAGEGPQLAIDDLVLIGIVKARGKLIALVSTGPQGFPHKIQPGDKFADGYVLSISESSVVFRKTSDRGVRLPKPRDVVKEISQEEP